MQRTIVTICLATSILASATNARSLPKVGETMGYFLPKTQVLVQISQRITQCPDQEHDLGIDSQLVIKPKTVPDQYVEVDIRSGLFAERSTGLTFRPNGTLEAFNAKSEGQAGKVLGSVLKLATTFAGFGLSNGMYAAETESTVNPGCNPATKASLEALRKTQERVDALELEIAEKGETTLRLAMLERLDDEVARLVDQLTVTSKISLYDLTTSSGTILRAPDYSQWLDRKSASTIPIVGWQGFSVNWDVSKANDRIKAGDGTRLDGPNAALVYRRSIDVPITVTPCAEAWDDKAGSCTPDERWVAQKLTDTVRVPVPQLSGLFSLHVGKGGLFGSKEAKAKFDEFGSPLELEYGTNGGASDSADLLDGSIASVVALRESELSELERRIKIAKARKELADLGGND